MEECLRTVVASRLYSAPSADKDTDAVDDMVSYSSCHSCHAISSTRMCCSVAFVEYESQLKGIQYWLKLNVFPISDQGLLIYKQLVFLSVQINFKIPNPLYNEILITLLSYTVYVQSVVHMYL